MMLVPLDCASPPYKSMQEVIVSRGVV
jgi:hypothetical protein